MPDVLRRLTTRPARPRGERGFTLIEVIVTLTFVGVMMVIAIPFLRVSPARHVRGAGGSLVRYLEMTRTQALAAKAAVRVVFDVSQNQYVAFLDDDRDGTIAEDPSEASAMRTATRGLPPTVQFGRGSAPEVPNYPGGGSTTFASNKLNFDNRGLTLPFGTRGVVYLVHRDDANAVVAVTVSGSASLRLWVYIDGAWQ